MIALDGLSCVLFILMEQINYTFIWKLSFFATESMELAMKSIQFLVVSFITLSLAKSGKKVYFEKSPFYSLRLHK